jgi:hypothetical protein
MLYKEIALIYLGTFAYGRYIIMYVVAVQGEYNTTEMLIDDH